MILTKCVPALRFFILKTVRKVRNQFVSITARASSRSTRILLEGCFLITINGNRIEQNKLSLKEYLESTGLNPKRIAVEINGEILPKSEYDSSVLKDGDKVEIVNFVGGG